MKEPEVVEPYDATRLSASVAVDGQLGRRPLAALAAWGQNREIHGILDAYLLEGTLWLTTVDGLYGRAELVVKDILDAGGFHPRGFLHPHRLSRIGAFTGGYVRDVMRARGIRVGLGGDVTAYRVPHNLKESYGSPFSFHLFFRYRPDRPAAHVHVH